MRSKSEEEDAIFGGDGDDDTLVTSFHDSEQTRLGRTKWRKSESLFVGNALLDLFVDCEPHWRQFDQLFECIEAFAV